MKRREGYCRTRRQPTPAPVTSSAWSSRVPGTGALRHHHTHGGLSPSRHMPHRTHRAAGCANLQSGEKANRRPSDLEPKQQTLPRSALLRRPSCTAPGPGPWGRTRGRPRGHRPRPVWVRPAFFLLCLGFWPIAQCSVFLVLAVRPD